MQKKKKIHRNNEITSKKCNQKLHFSYLQSKSKIAIYCCNWWFFLVPYLSKLSHNDFIDAMHNGNERLIARMRISKNSLFLHEIKLLANSNFISSIVSRE